MALNIKNDEVDELAETLRELTGDSKTKIVRDALREKLAKEKTKRDVDAKVEAALEIGRRAAAHKRDDAVTLEELLYDERGLPR